MENSLVKKLSIAALLLSTQACASKPYTQVQIAQGKGQYFPKKGNVDITCARLRAGGKTIESKHTKRQEEVRLGTDVCYTELPSVSSEDTYSIDASIIQESALVRGTTDRYQVKLSPIAEYKLFSIEAKLPIDSEQWGLLIQGYKDLDLSLWLGMGYNLDITTKSTDYATGDNTVHNIPGLDVNGQFFGELNHELLIFGRIPLGASVRLDQRGEDGMTFLFNAGYRIQW